MDKENLSFEKLKNMWSELGDICINENDCIEEDFYWWKSGTDRYEIWHWFDEQCPTNLHDDLMFL